jgi:2-polyprenyl-3-methyl-5-hydroxy-6-metoxy-1,4-benzoquinol methylase
VLRNQKAGVFSRWPGIAVPHYNRSLQLFRQFKMPGGVKDYYFRMIRRWYSYRMKRYFERRFAAEDTWRLDSSEYEQTRLDTIISAIGDAPVNRILEVGCAEGHLTRRLAALGAEIVGLDISERAIAKARDRCRGMRNITFACRDVASAELDGTFDLILATEVLYYLIHRHGDDDLAFVCRKLANAMRPNGLLVTTNWFDPLAPQSMAMEARIHQACMAPGLVAVSRTTHSGTVNERIISFNLALFRKARA